MPRWLVFALLMGALWFLAAHPMLLAAVLGYGAILATIAFFIFGLIFYLQYNDVMPPLWLGLIILALCFIFPSGFGLLAGLALIGGLTMCFLFTLDQFD